MTTNCDVSTNSVTFYFCIFGHYEANIAPISTNVFLFSYKFDSYVKLWQGYSISWLHPVKIWYKLVEFY